MQRDESLLSLSAHWGIIIKIFLFLCQMEEREKQLGFGKEQKGSRAFYGSCRKIRAAILHAERYQLVGHFFWAGDARLIELLDHPNNFSHFFELNSKLNWLTSYLGQDGVTANDVYCLSGHDDMIQKVLNSRGNSPMTPGKIKQYCLLTLMSERPAAIRFFCAMMRIQNRNLLPVMVRSSFVKKSESAQLKETLLYELCLHGNAAAWQCFADFVTEDALRDYMTSSAVLDILISEEHERQFLHPYSLRALLNYVDPIKCQSAFAKFRARMMQYGRLDLVKVMLDFTRSKSTLNKIDCTDLRVIVKSGHFSLLKKMLAINPGLMRQLSNPSDPLGMTLVCALLEAQDPNLDILIYLLEDINIKLGGEHQVESNLFMVVFKRNEVLAQLLRYYPDFVTSKNYDNETPLQYLLKRSVVTKHTNGDPVWQDWCFANVISLVQAGADPFEAFNLALSQHMVSSIGLMTLHAWPLFDEAIICFIQSGLNLNAIDNNRFSISYILLLCYDYMKESTLSLILSQPINFDNFIVQKCLSDAFNKACANYSSELAVLFIAKGASLRCDSVARAIDFNFTQSDADAESRYAQFCHELKNGDQFTVAGLTGLDLAIINSNLDVVRVITKALPRDALVEVLTTNHLNDKKSTYDLAVALNNADIIHTIDCLLELKQITSFSVGI